MLPDHVLELLQRGEPVAALVPDFREGFRTWIGIHPFSIHPLTQMSAQVTPGEKTHFRVRCFHLQNEFDLDEYDFHGDECEYRFNHTTDSIDEVEQLLRSVLADLSILDESRKCDYPF